MTVYFFLAFVRNSHSIDFFTLFQECPMRTGSKKVRLSRMIAVSFLFVVVLISLATAVMGSKRKIKVMPLGDSITGSQEGAASYRFWLFEQIVAAGFGDKVEFVGKRCGCGDQDGVCVPPEFPCSVWSCKHNGYHENTIGMILDNSSFLLASDTPDVVLMHLGTNDVISGYGTTLPGTKNNMEKLIDTIRNYNPNVIILLCKLNYSFGQRDSFVVFNSYMTQVAAEKNQTSSPVILVDQFTGFDPGSDDIDGVHPNESGEHKLAAKFFDALLPVLQKLTGIQAQIGNYSGDVRANGGAPYSLQANVHAFPQAQDVVFIANDTVSLGSGSKVNDSLFTYAFTAGSGFKNIKAVVSDFCGHTDTSAAVLFGAPVNVSAMDLSIPTLQGPVGMSPYENYQVTTTGVVTAIAKDSSGFWLQDTLGDGSDLTSDAVFVSKSNAFSMPPKGFVVLVRGIVQEYVGKPGSLSSTRIRCVDSVAVLYDFHNRISSAAVTGIPDFDMNNMKSLYAGHEGMLFSFNNAVAVSSASGAAIIPSGMRYYGSGYYATSGVVENESRGSHVVDYNPEVLLLGNKTGSVLALRAGDTISKLTGVVDYVNGNYFIQPITDSCVVSAHVAVPPSPVSVRTSGAGSFRISTLDCDGFYDTIDTWGKNDVVVSPADYATRLAKIGKAVSQELLMPALLCVQNVENTNTLKDVASSVNALGGKYKYTSGRKYVGYSIDTPSTSNSQGLINGFLYDSTAMALSQAFLLTGSSINAAFGPTSPFPTAEPLVGAFTVGGTLLAIVNVTLADKTSDQPYFMRDWPVYEPSKAARVAQAAAVRSWINGVLASYPSLYMLVAGEFNDYPFAEPTDGADYPVEIVAGSPARGESVFYNAYDYLPPDTRYTCIRDGKAQMTEQIMVNSNLAGLAKAVDVLHFNAKFEDTLATNPATPIRVSRHDAVEIRF